MVPPCKRLPRVAKIIIVGVALIIATWFSPLGLQKRNLIAAQRHVNLIVPRVRADSRFQKVRVITYTGNYGCLWIGGSVNSRAEAEALKDLVVSTNPPVATRFMVFVSSEANGPRPIFALTVAPKN